MARGRAHQLAFTLKSTSIWTGSGRQFSRFDVIIVTLYKQKSNKDELFNKTVQSDCQDNENTL